MRHLVLVPDTSSYSFSDGTSTAKVDLGGGRGRYRRTFVGAHHSVSCSWTLSHEEYKYIRAFYNTATIQGSLPFTIDLITDTPSCSCCDMEKHEAYFQPGTMTLNSKAGHVYKVSAQLEVKPIKPDDDCYRMSNFEVRHALGDGYQSTFDALGQLFDGL